MLTIVWERGYYIEDMKVHRVFGLPGCIGCYTFVRRCVLGVDIVELQTSVIKEGNSCLVTS